MRLTVDIPEEEIISLDRLSLAENTPCDRLLEQALVPFLQAREPRAERAGDWHEYFGALKDFPEDGQAFQDRIWSEWDRDRS